MLEARRWLAPGCLAAAIALGWGLQVSNGFQQATGLALVTVGILCAGLAVVLPRPARLADGDRPLVGALAAIGLALHIWYLLTSVPGFYIRLDAAGERQFHAGVIALGLLGGWAIVRTVRLRGAGADVRADEKLPRTAANPWLVTGSLAVAMAAVHLALGLWVIDRSPDPAIDVHIFQKYAAVALWHGQNPYSLTFPDIYNNGGFYGDGLSVNGRLQFGFPYFPLSLLAAMPGQLLAHDPRYSQLVAIDVAALLMALARPGGLGLAAAALYLTTPRNFFVLEQSWTEPFVVLGAATVVFAACRRSWLTPWLFGAFVAIKQYLVFALPAVVLLAARRDGVRGVMLVLLKGALVGAVVTLPFVLWDAPAFLRSVVTLQFYQPFRGDALSYLAWWAAQGHEQPSTVIPFLVAAVTSVIAVWRLPRTAAGFSAALALTFFVFFGLNKQAFANYYFFVLGTLLMTVAAWNPATVSAASSPRTMATPE